MTDLKTNVDDNYATIAKLVDTNAIWFDTGMHTVHAVLEPTPE